MRVREDWHGRSGDRSRAAKRRGQSIPDFGEPAPLPNPAVFQKHDSAPKTEEVTITLQPGEQTEIKALLKTAKVVTFSWQA